MELGLGPYPCSALTRCPCVINTLSDLSHPCGPAGGLPSCVCPEFIYTLSLWNLVSQLLSAHGAHTRRVFTTHTDSLFPHFPVSICRLHNEPPCLSSFLLSVLCKLQFPPQLLFSPPCFRLLGSGWASDVFCICVFLCGSHQPRVLKLVQVETSHSIKYKLHFKDSSTHRSKQSH